MHSLYTLTAWALGIAYPRKMGNAKALASGMSNSSDTRASFLVCFESNSSNSTMDLAFWVSALEEERIRL